MSTMNISLPPRLREFVEQQVESGRYSTASEYVRELIRSDEKRRAQEKLEEMLLEGVNSGPAIEVNPQFWQDKLRRLKDKIDPASSGERPRA